MFGIKDLKEEMAEMNKTLKELNEEMKGVRKTLEETNKTIDNSLQMTSETIKEMSENFSKALEEALRKMSEFKLQMDVRDTVLQSLGLKDMIPDFLKKKRK